MLSVIMLSVIMLCVIMLSVIMLSVIMLSVIMLSVIMLSVVMLVFVVSDFQPSLTFVLKTLNPLRLTPRSQVRLTYFREKKTLQLILPERH
jgi:hypothetical protein